MTNWIDDFIESYSNYKKITKCLNKGSIDKQAICLIKLNAPKKKKKKGKRGY
ncbi:hypothetical protein ES705_32256 [subsurface metagenome]